MDIVVTGRHVNVSDRFRQHITEKLAKVTQLAPRTRRVEVMVSHEPNRRQAKACERVEITCHDKGPVVRELTRAEAEIQGLVDEGLTWRMSESARARHRAAETAGLLREQDVRADDGAHLRPAGEIQDRRAPAAQAALHASRRAPRLGRRCSRSVAADRACHCQSPASSICC